MNKTTSLIGSKPGTLEEVQLRTQENFTEVLKHSHEGMKDSDVLQGLSIIETGSGLYLIKRFLRSKENNVLP